MHVPALFLSLLLTASPGWPPVVGDGVDPYAHGYWPARVRRLERVEWRFSAGVKTGMAVPGADGLIRVMAGGGTIHALDPATGRQRWARAGHTRFWNYSSLVLGPDGTAYGGNHTWMQAVGPDGALRWRTGLNASWIHKPPALSPDGKTLYAGADNVGIVSLDAATGEVNWLCRDFKSPWSHYTFDPDGRLVAGVRGRVVCFEQNGKVAWEIPEGVSTLMTAGTMLVLTREKTLTALDFRTREPRFTVKLPARIHGTALTDDGRIVVTMRSGEMAQVDLRGRLRWVRRISGQRLSRPATARGGETLVMDLGGRLYLLDSNGREISGIDTGASFFRWRPSVGPDGRVYVNHDGELLCIGGAERPAPKPVRATTLLVVADDFVVDVWVNGDLVPLGARKRLVEYFGAVTERIHVDLREGDWVVFNVVANRLRWGGASYFGVHATDDDDRVDFVSRTGGGWFACDDPGKVPAFIAERDALLGQPAVAPEHPWKDARDRWRGQLGADFTGEPVWGKSANTWIKYLVPERDQPPSTSSSASGPGGVSSSNSSR